MENGWDGNVSLVRLGFVLGDVMLSQVWFNKVRLSKAKLSKVLFRLYKFLELKN